jgi:hypothetical protein
MNLAVNQAKYITFANTTNFVRTDFKDYTALITATTGSSPARVSEHRRQHVHMHEALRSCSVLGAGEVACAAADLPVVPCRRACRTLAVPSLLPSSPSLPPSVRLTITFFCC